MLEITADHIAALEDDDLRSLVGRLCEAEMRMRGLPDSVVTYGGDQNAPDGGIDIRVDLPPGTAIEGFVPRPKLGLQVKKTKFSASQIKREMLPAGVLRPSIRELALHSGAYVIVSGGANASDEVLSDLRAVMRAAVAEDANADELLVDYYDGPRLAIWLRGHPGLIPWVRAKIGRAIQGWKSYDAWAFSPDGVEDVYLEDEKLRVHGARRKDQGASIADTIAQLRSRLSKSRSVVRLAGLSGVGKTRLVQALFDKRVGENALDPASVIYTDMGQTPDPSPTAVAENLCASRSRLILVVDNCPHDLHRRLSDICRRPNSLLSVITVEYDIQEDEPEGTDVYRLEPSSDDLIRNLLRRRFPNLSAVDATTIARFSGGNARSAIAVAGTVGRNETVASLSDRELLERLFYQGNAPDPALMLAAQVLALVYSFEGETLSGDAAELPKLAALMGTTATNLFQHVSVLMRRDLVQQRSVWRALLPHTIANNLAKLALKSFPVPSILAAMDTERLLKSFARRLGYLHDSDEARTIVSRWLAPDGMLGRYEIYTRAGETMFDLVAPVLPDHALAVLERAIGTDADTVKVDSWRFDAAARLLRSLAFEAVNFERCIKLLLVLALAEHRQDRRSRQSLSEMIVHMFQIRFSGTHAPIEARVAVVRGLLASDNEFQQNLGVRALEELLRTRSFHATHSFEFGARTRDYGYAPKTRADIEHWFRTAFQVVEPLACSKHRLAARMRSVVARYFNGLWSAAKIHDELDRFVRAMAAHHSWQDGWIAIRKTLADHAKDMPATDRERLEGLEQLLRPSDLVSRTRTIAFSEAWGHLDFADLDRKDNEDGKDVMSRMQKASALSRQLGESVAADDGEALKTLLPELVTGNRGRRQEFGAGLATAIGDRTARWKALVEASHAAPEGQRNFAVHLGYLSGLSVVEPQLADAFLDGIFADAVFRHWIPVLQTAMPISDAGAARLLRAINEDVAPIKRYEALAGGRYLDEMRTEDVKAVVDAIAKRPDGFQVACEILSMRLYSEKEKKRELEALGEIGRGLLEGISFKDADDMHDHRLTEIAKVSLKSPEGAETVSVVCKHLKRAMANHEYFRSDLDKFVPTLFEMQPRAALDGFFAGGARSAKMGVGLIQDICHNHDNPLDRAPDDVVVGWCDRHPASRYPMLARVVSYCCDGENAPLVWSPLARSMLDRAPDKLAVLKQFVDRFHPFMCEGSRALYLEHRMRLLDALPVALSAVERAWLETKRSELQKDLEAQRKSEAQRDRDRDESFE